VSSFIIPARYGHQIGDTSLCLGVDSPLWKIVSTAYKFAILISKGVSLTSPVLKNSGYLLGNDCYGKVCSQSAIKMVDGIFEDYLGVLERWKGFEGYIPNAGSCIIKVNDDEDALVRSDPGPN